MSADAYICDAMRTPIGRYNGQLAHMRADDLAAVPIRTLVARNPQLDPSDIDDVFLGCANQAGEDNRNVARMALLLAGLPVSCPGVTVNRLCASGLEAVAQAARVVRTQEGALVVMGKAGAAFARTARLEDTTMGWRFVNDAFAAIYGVDTMPETAENVADHYSISRTDQDGFALRSQARADAAIKSGRFAPEIIGVVSSVKADPANNLVLTDEHPRATNAETLAKLKPVARPNGTVTAGNASGINDGAAALIVASAAAVAANGLRPRAKVTAYGVAGVEPRMMGIGPIPAITRLLDRTKMRIADFDIIEINEAFAAQALAVTRHFGLADDAEHVNPNGGAIALGHPLGMSGTRLVMTAVEELERRGGHFALVAMCVGVGQGAAMILERTERSH
jgi:3-oxoadipyl-CoA thiolase